MPMPEHVHFLVKSTAMIAQQFALDQTDLVVLDESRDANTDRTELLWELGFALPYLNSHHYIMPVEATMHRTDDGVQHLIIDKAPFQPPLRELDDPRMHVGLFITGVNLPQFRIELTHEHLQQIKDTIKRTFTEDQDDYELDTIFVIIP